MSDYIPANDSQFSDWLASFGAYLSVHYAEFGLIIDDVNKLEDILGPAWTTALTTHVAAQNTSRSATASKNEARAAVVAYVRSLVGRINAYPTTTDAQREAFGLRPGSAATSDTDLPASDDRPLAIVDVSSRLKHVIRLQNQTTTGTKKGKPAGAVGCEIWRKVGVAPSGVSDMEFVGLATRSPYVVEYTDADGGKQAYYACRWVSSRGEKGSWSEPESATIAA